MISLPPFLRLVCHHEGIEKTQGTIIHLFCSFLFQHSVYNVSLYVLPSTEHEASVTAVGVSDDGMKILAATASVTYTGWGLS